MWTAAQIGVGMSSKLLWPEVRIPRRPRLTQLPCSRKTLPTRWKPASPKLCCGRRSGGFAPRTLRSRRWR